MSHDVQLTPAASHSPAATPPNLELPHDNPDDHENTHVTGSITYSSPTGHSRGCGPLAPRDLRLSRGGYGTGLTAPCMAPRR